MRIEMYGVLNPVAFTCLAVKYRMLAPLNANSADIAHQKKALRSERKMVWRLNGDNHFEKFQALGTPYSVQEIQKIYLRSTYLTKQVDGFYAWLDRNPRFWSAMGFAQAMTYFSNLWFSDVERKAKRLLEEFIGFEKRIRLIRLQQKMGRVLRDVGDGWNAMLKLFFGTPAIEVL